MPEPVTPNPDEGILAGIDKPEDLRKLDEAQLQQLSTEIRDFIVRATSVTGGHLGSNLGAVELTLALHRSFDSPKDILLWDTGHLAYVHKIVTGRKADFPTLRQAGGLSGYPSRSESPHDWIENSHASTALSYAHGMATAVKAAGTDRRVVTVLGDGSLTGGMAFEALNNLGHSNARVMIVLNDNGRSYAPTVGWLSGSLSKLRAQPRYMSARNAIERRIKSMPGVGGLAAASVKGMKAAVREAVEPFAFFEALGVRYIGPIDGHDVLGMERAFRNAADYDGPIVVHVLTQKGRGYEPAETDDEKHLHDVKVFDLETGPLPAGKVGDYTEAFTNAIVKVAEKHPQVHAITAAMPGPTGLLPFQERFPERFLDVGIAEQHAVTAAAGMAMGGLRPVVAVYSTFLTRAFDQTMFDVGLHGVPVVFALDRSGITGDDGPSHHGVLDMALCMRVPGMTVFAPSSAEEIEVMLRDALELDGPASIRYPKGAARHVSLDEIGSGLDARQARGGGDVAIVGVGKLLAPALQAAEALAASGIDAAVWDPRVVKPLDEKMLDALASYSTVVTVEDGMRVGGVGSAIQAALSERGNVSVRILGTPDEFIPHGKPDAVLAKLGLDAAGIERSVRDAMSQTVVEIPR